MSSLHIRGGTVVNADRQFRADIITQDGKIVAVGEGLATPAGATGRVYGLVYSGLDIGMSVSPAIFGLMMDAQRPAWVFVGIAVFQGALIGSALNIGRITGRPVAVRA